MDKKRNLSNDIVHNELFTLIKSLNKKKIKTFWRINWFWQIEMDILYVMEHVEPRRRPI